MQENARVEKVKQAIQGYFEEYMPHHPELPTQFWEKIEEAVE